MTGISGAFYRGLDEYQRQSQAAQFNRVASQLTGMGSSASPDLVFQNRANKIRLKEKPKIAKTDFWPSDAKGCRGSKSAFECLKEHIDEWCRI